MGSEGQYKQELAVRRDHRRDRYLLRDRDRDWAERGRKPRRKSQMQKLRAEEDPRGGPRTVSRRGIDIPKRIDMFTWTEPVLRQKEIEAYMKEMKRKRN